MTALRAGRFGLALGLACAVVACASRPAATVRPEPARIASLPSVLPPGSDWVVHLRPVRWFATAAGTTLAPSLRLAVGLDGFDERFGLSLSEVDELVVASYQGDRLYLLRGADETALSHVQTHTPGPAGGSPRATMIERDILLVRDLGPVATIVEALRTGRRDPLLGQLAAGVAEVPLAIYIARPLALPPETGVGRLLQRQTAMLATATGRPEGTLALEVQLRGQFPASADRNVRQFFAAIAVDPLGQALGLQATLADMRVSHRPGAIDIGLTLDPARLARVIAVLANADTWAFVDDRSAAGSDEPR